jgi:hypothetical protein
MGERREEPAATLPPPGSHCERDGDRDARERGRDMREIGKARE